MQREGLIGFALLLTLAVLAPQEGSHSQAAAAEDVAAVPITLTRSVDEVKPTMTLAGPESESSLCDNHEHEKASPTTAGSDAHLKFNVNVSI